MATTTKKTTAKPAAAKKTTTAKTTTAKSTTAKAAAPAKKTTTAPSANELTVSGNKKLDTLRKEFNKKFPYLHLTIAYSYARKDVAAGGSIQNIPGDKTIAQVRRVDSGGTISISGNKKVKTLEKEFDTVFGLYCQVCYTTADGRGLYTGEVSDEKTLAALNAECEKNGCKKGVWK